MSLYMCVFFYQLSQELTSDDSQKVILKENDTFSSLDELRSKIKEYEEFNAVRLCIRSSTSLRQCPFKYNYFNLDIGNDKYFRWIIFGCIHGEKRKSRATTRKTRY